jgi:hypothetical protein
LAIQIYNSLLIYTLQCFQVDRMDLLGTWIDRMESRFKGLNIPAKPLLEPHLPLPNLLIRIRTPTTDARTPGPQATGKPPTSIEDSLIASGLMLLILVVGRDGSLVFHLVLITRFEFVKNIY